MAKQIEVPKPTKVPCNWCWIELGKLTSMKSGYPFDSKRFAKNASVNSRPLIRIRDVIKGETETYTDQECPEEYIIKRGDILIGMDGDFNVGKWQSEDALLNQRVCCIQSCSSLYLDEFLFYYLPEPLKKINDATPSVTVKHLSTKTLAITPVPVPPLAEQQRIVDRIENLFAKLDEAKQKAQDALDSFESRKAAILHKAFTGELIGKPSTATTTLEEITTCIRIGPFGSALHKEDYILGGIPVVNPKHIIHQKIVPEEKITVSVQKAEELSSYILQENDIILGRRGDMGRSAPVTDLETGWLCGTGSMIIRLKSGYNAKFYSQIIASQAAVRYLEENSVGSTMKNLNEKIVRLLPIPDFTVDEQLKIVRILDNLLVKEQQAKEAAEKVLEQIDLIKKSILARAFRGELGTNDPTEQSAVELLRQVLSTSDM